MRDMFFSKKIALVIVVLFSSLSIKHVYAGEDLITVPLNDSGTIVCEIIDGQSYLSSIKDSVLVRLNANAKSRQTRKSIKELDKSIKLIKTKIAKLKKKDPSAQVNAEIAKSTKRFNRYKKQRLNLKELLANIKNCIEGELIPEPSTPTPSPSPSPSASATPTPQPTLSCFGNDINCSNQCVDISSDVSNCGGCGIVCPQDMFVVATCQAGLCLQS